MKARLGKFSGIMVWYERFRTEVTIYRYQPLLAEADRKHVYKNVGMKSMHRLSLLMNHYADSIDLTNYPFISALLK